VRLGGAGNVQVRVVYAGVSMPDVLMASGRYQTRHPLPFTPGCEFSGVVESSSDDRFLPGARVAGLVTHGAFAQAVRVDADSLLPLPDMIPLDQAAALPVNYLTVYYALHDRARVAPGNRVLVRGAGGGIGTAAVELARCAGAGEICAVASSARKRDVATSLGAGRAVARIADLPDDVRFDIVVDPVGGDDAVEAMRRLEQHGKHLIVGFTSGTIPSVAFNRLLLRNIDLIGVYLGRRREVAPADVLRAWDAICDLVVAGRISPAIDSIHPLTDAAEAMRIIDERRACGKVLLGIGAE
jgi:NADPH2:quinone reductase